MVSLRMFKLALSEIMKNRRQYGLLISFVFIVSFIFISVPSYFHHQEGITSLYLQKSYGSWVVLSEEERESSLKGKIDILCETEDYSLGSFNQDMFEMASLSLLDGRMPTHDREIIVETTVLDQLQKEYKLYQSIDIQGKDYILVGIIRPYTLNWIMNPYIDYPQIITKDNNNQSQYVFYQTEDVKDTDFINTFAYPQYQSNQDKDNRGLSIVVYFIGCSMLCYAIYRHYLFKKRDHKLMIFLGISLWRIFFVEVFQVLFCICTGSLCGYAIGECLLKCYFEYQSIHLSVPYIYDIHLTHLISCILLLFLISGYLWIIFWLLEKIFKMIYSKSMFLLKIIIFLGSLLLLVDLGSVYRDAGYRYMFQRRLNIYSDYTYVSQEVNQGLSLREIQEILEIEGIQSIYKAYCLQLDTQIGLLPFIAPDLSYEEYLMAGFDLTQEEFEKIKQGKQIYLFLPMDKADQSITPEVLDKLNGENKIDLGNRIISFDKIIYYTQENFSGQIFCSNVYGILCSEQYLIDKFQYECKDYQEVVLKANRYANYATDTNISKYGFENNRIVYETQKEKYTQKLIVSLSRYLLEFIIVVNLVYMIHKMNFNTLSYQLTIEQLLGISLKNIKKRYVDMFSRQFLRIMLLSWFFVLVKRYVFGDFYMRAIPEYLLYHLIQLILICGMSLFVYTLRLMDYQKFIRKGIIERLEA